MPTPKAIQEVTYRTLQEELDRAARERPGSIPTIVHLLAFHLGQQTGLERRRERRDFTEGAEITAEAARVTSTENMP